MDGWFKAVDARNGAPLWQYKTGSGIIGQPVTYRGPDGKQYVAVMSGVGGWAGAIVAGDLDPRDSTAALGFAGGDEGPARRTRRREARSTCSRCHERDVDAIDWSRRIGSRSVQSRSRCAPARLRATASSAASARSAERDAEQRAPERAAARARCMDTTHVAGTRTTTTRMPSSEGQRLFGWYNCAGCHANGGGGMGPPLMDDEWIYGSSPENIYTTIVQGRPNGMPSFAGKIPTPQVWMLVAYVRSLSALNTTGARVGAQRSHDDVSRLGSLQDPEKPKQSFRPPAAEMP